MSSKQTSNLCVGIDLGTTNSAIAVVNEKRNGNIVSAIVGIPREGIYEHTTTYKTLPSCVYYREKNYQPVVGDFAKSQYPLRPYLVAKSIKSQMGKAEVEGLSEDVPDKTPPEVASKILKWMLYKAQQKLNLNKEPITEAVITVPANFDSAMCRATIQAAELAGIKTKNDDGTEKAILLSEPNAVIYNLINEIRNGEIGDYILDLSKKKMVLVFDIGGGTLDITMHEIKRREKNQEVIKINEIATNRYTLLGGDDFDDKIAAVMYERYKKQYQDNKSVVLKIEKEKDAILPILKTKAEQLKIKLSENVDYSAWDDEEEKEALDPSINIHVTGYPYDDTFTKEELENILLPFMATELKFEDYKRIDKISDTKNIIYPILDVLSKAEKILGEGNVVVDKVIVNGGMSQFYMITDRLEKFFGPKLSIISDPDITVAKGAAIYHYYLKKDAQLQDDMKIIESKQESKQNIMTPTIELEKNVSDSLYLGLKNGAKVEIIPAGVKLPYTSEPMSGFKMEPEEKESSILIKCKNIDGSDRIIANGKISLKENYEDGAFLFFKIHMDINKVISIMIWTSTDYLGINKIEEQYIDIVIDNKEQSSIKNRILPPRGSVLPAKVEIETMTRLYKNIQEKKSKMRRKYPQIENKESQEVSKLKKKIDVFSDNICNAGNKGEFAIPILENIENNFADEVKWRLFYIARKVGDTWTALQRKKLATECMNYIKLSHFKGSLADKIRIDTTIQAILTFSMCGTKKQIDDLFELCHFPMYVYACLYVYAKTHTNLEFLREKLNQIDENFKNDISIFLYIVRVVLKEYEEDIMLQKTKYSMIEYLCNIIKHKDCMVLEDSILTLAFLCEQKQKIKPSVVEHVVKTITDVEETDKKIKRIKETAIKIIKEEELNSSEENFVSMKLNL